MLTKENTAHYWTAWPNPVALTLLRRTASGDTSDTLSAGVSQPTCRETPLDRQDYNSVSGTSLNQESTNWQIWDRGQAYFPKRGDVLVTSGSVRWMVVHVRRLIFGNLYVCTCVKEPQTS